MVANNDKANRLKPKQRALIPYLISSSVNEACRQSDRCTSTVHRWLKQLTCKAALKEVHQDEAFSDGFTRIRAMSPRRSMSSWSCLRAKTINQDQSGRTSSKYAVKLNHDDELEKRINELEERLKEQR
jgi:hypothetical protein